MGRPWILVVAAALLVAGSAALSRPGPTANAIWRDPVARANAIRAGAPLFARHCAACHGADLKGRPDAHTPDLTDDRWLYGGQDIDTFVMQASDIERTILHGIRSGDPAGRNWPAMPARGAGHSLEADEIAAVTEYVLKLSGQPHDAAQAEAGREVYEGEGDCVDCHTLQGWGDPATGAADLTRPRTWLYGTTRTAIAQSVTEGRRGVCGADRYYLYPYQARELAVYVLSKAKTRKYI